MTFRKVLVQGRRTGDLGRTHGRDTGVIVCTQRGSLRCLPTSLSGWVLTKSRE